MHQLGGTRGCAFSKIVRLEQHNGQTTQHSIKRNTQTRSAAPDHNQIDLIEAGKTIQQNRTISDRRRSGVGHGGGH
jgi:hypothetical protein